MEIYTFGLVCAAATFLNIWIGHVSVRAIERRSERLWQPMAVFALAGVFALASSLNATGNNQAVLGITGFMLLWDSFEFYRQQKRIRIGHAPANPANPRHQRILEEFANATTVDLLDRSIRGRQYSEDEIATILKEESTK
ncbi:MAG TPA: DUF4491 family protein [Anaerolineales bacterium]|nr:DUF4491 family protein [Anaerolineales bacterium]